MSFDKRLRKIRGERNLTQKQVAQAVSVTERNYQLYEAGSQKPGFDTLLAMADYFGVSLDYLVGRVRTPSSFRSWLSDFGELNTPMGIFSHDVNRDSLYPADDERYTRLFQYFDWQSRRQDNPSVLRLFETAWAFYVELRAQD